MTPNTLSKSRFKIALECPTKLNFSGDDRYVNIKSDDEFLEALADGGHKVGALAQRMYPNGVEIAAASTSEQVQQTAELLKQDQVTLFEPTIQHGGCLVRVDILIKNGHSIDLIEVKAKGFDVFGDSFRGKRDPIAAEWRPYLYDIAFQQHVLQRAHPQWQITPHLMLLDPTAPASIAGIGAQFQVDRIGHKVRVKVSPSFDARALEPPLLRLHDVSELVHDLIGSPVDTPAGTYTFDNLIERLSGDLAAARPFPPTPGAACRRCEFYCEPADISESKRSGWAECMSQAFQLPVNTSRSNTVFGLYNHRGVEALLAAGRHRLVDLTEADLNVVREPGGISATERNFYQVQEARGSLRRAAHWERESLRPVLGAWRFPIHFVDFETARPALPYQSGFKSAQQLLFQFSHHVLVSPESLRHQSEFLLATPTVEPRIPALRALRAALGNDNGTVVHWWDHERNVLSDLARQIKGSNEPDGEHLAAFIVSLLGTEERPGRLADLGRLISKYAFFAGTGGSSSIKKVLPSVLRHSAYLRARYGAPIYGTARMPSLNFSPGWIWYREKGGHVCSPYELLDALFTDPEVNAALSSITDEDNASPDFIASGGSAMIAYGTLQNPALPAKERSLIERQLKRYCELDTLAMVMIYEHAIAELNA